MKNLYIYIFNFNKRKKKKNKVLNHFIIIKFLYFNICLYMYIYLIVGNIVYELIYILWIYLKIVDRKYKIFG